MRVQNAYLTHCGHLCKLGFFLLFPFLFWQNRFNFEKYNFPYLRPVLGTSLTVTIALLVMVLSRSWHSTDYSTGQFACPDICSVVWNKFRPAKLERERFLSRYSSYLSECKTPTLSVLASHIWDATIPCSKYKDIAAIAQSLMNTLKTHPNQHINTSFEQNKNSGIYGLIYTRTTRDVFENDANWATLQLPLPVHALSPIFSHDTLSGLCMWLF